MDSQNPCPETSSSFPSRITFSWFNSLAWTGYKRAILDTDLWDLNPRDRSATVAPIFDKNWAPNLKAANLSSRKSETIEADLDGKEKVVVKTGGKSPKENLSIFLPLVKSFGVSFLYGSVIKLFHDLMVFIQPLLLRRIIAFSEPVCEDCAASPVWQGVLYAVVLMLVTMCQTVLLSSYFYNMYLIGMWTKSSIISAIYRKALVVTAESKKGSTSGEIVNLMSVDAQKISDLLPYLNMLWSSPLQITVAIYFLYQILGPPVFAGLGTMIALIPINGFSAAITRKLQMKMMKQKDVRVKKMNELLSGMKILKLYAWEPSFMKDVVDIRNVELGILLNIGYLSAAISFIWTCAPFLVSLVTFAVYVLSDENNVLDAQKAFTSLALFNILRFPMSMLPMMITSAVQASVSIKRINKFMRSEELNPEAVGKSEDTKAGNAITVKGASFDWGEKPTEKTDEIEKDKKNKKTPAKNGAVNGTNGKVKSDAEGHNDEEGEEETSLINGTSTVTKQKAEPFSLKNIDLSIGTGSLVAVVGTVGSGKSSLLSALLGEMEKGEGSVEVCGRVAYVSQQAWIQNAKLKDNILFGAKMSEERYSKALDDCALISDLEILPAKDETEIGEKGINLSGGQKQRVSLARAVYADADIYLLDDPLSAVDSHVGKHIFDRVIGPDGCLRTKTRVLVTHGVTFLSKVDKIVVMKKGAISEIGSYRELLAQKGDFADFLVEHLSDLGEDSELAVIKTELEEHLGQAELERQVTRNRTTSTMSDESRDSKTSLNTNENNRKSASPVKSPAPAKTEKPAADKPNLQAQYQEEKQGTGSVSWRVYMMYFRAMGFVLFGGCIVLYTVYQIFLSFSSIWVSFWSDNKLPFEEELEPGEERNMTSTRRDIFLGIYGATGLCQALGAVFASLLLYLATISGGRVLHHKMLDRIMRAPMSFFDTTPQGRILNRFGKDVDVLDSTMPFILRGWISCLLSVVATFLVIIVTTPLAILPIFLVLGGYYFVQRIYVSASRQLKRLESTSRSPIYSHFGETINGASVIRAYGLQNTFIKESERRVDKNHQATFCAVIANRWLAVRLETVGNCIIFAAALFAVLGRDTLSPGLVGLSVSYALQVTQTLNWLVRMSSELETNVVAVERLQEYR